MAVGEGGGSGACGREKDPPRIERGSGVESSVSMRMETEANATKTRDTKIDCCCVWTTRGGNSRRKRASGHRDGIFLISVVIDVRAVALALPPPHLSAQNNTILTSSSHRINLDSHHYNRRFRAHTWYFHIPETSFLVGDDKRPERRQIDRQTGETSRSIEII